MLNATRRFPLTGTFSASQSKIMVEQPLEDLENKNTETHKSVTCHFCQGSVEVVENLVLGSTWMFQWQSH